MITKLDKNVSRKKRHARVRSKLSGTAARPRLNVFRSSKHIYAQLIDDVNGVTLASASTMDKDFGSEVSGNKEAAQKVGELIAKRAVEKGITSVVFDRGGYLYHGRVQALADAARENGLQF
ncbi:50S ribosomal protein L18 [Neobacillus sp. SCS-31]|uniref:50S ribosomal protein L18 n=1 Tax=Neobacillus oceani TaxID=3115292 RepID=UPI003906148F